MSLLTQKNRRNIHLTLFEKPVYDFAILKLDFTHLPFQYGRRYGKNMGLAIIIYTSEFRPQGTRGRVLPKWRKGTNGGCVYSQVF
jgi:hypothetical protein